MLTSSSRQSIDADEEDGDDHCAEFHSIVSHDSNVVQYPARDIKSANKGRSKAIAHSKETIQCSATVHEGVHEWEIQGMSWLPSSLKQVGVDFAWSDPFVVGDDYFRLVYCPTGGELGRGLNNLARNGSLAISQVSCKGLTFRYQFFIKSASSNKFMPWGKQGDECHPDWELFGKVFGPDTHDVVDPSRDVRPAGIFGLTYSELLQSEWVKGDVLHVKVEVQVRADDGLRTRVNRTNMNDSLNVQIPDGSLSKDMRSLLADATLMDITFVLAPDHVMAHASILCARSVVFSKMLASGMNESVTKRITIEDCNFTSFKTFLKFLYTDDLDLVAKDCWSAVSPSSSAASASSTNSRSSMLKSLLALSQKYEVMRLRCWCEQQLCDMIGVGEVCSLLSLAHLHDAKVLEKRCLDFIKENMGRIVKTAEFGCLAVTWPEVMLKVNLHIIGLTENDAAESLQEAQRKRQKLGN